nr:transposase [Heyndrickxia coagulans]
MRKEREYNFETPGWLGIEEIHIIRRPRLILTNVEKHTIYDIQQNLNKETVVQRLSEISDKHYIEYITIEMWQPYKDAVKTVHAKLSLISFM